MENHPFLSDQHKLIGRLRRIEGQVHGVQKMVDTNRDCREIIQQLVAARSAMDSAILVFTEDYLTTCMRVSQKDDPLKREKMVKDLMTVMGKAL